MTMCNQLVDPAALFPAKYFQTKWYFWDARDCERNLVEKFVVRRPLDYVVGDIAG
jgi:hypothetical protein